MTNSRLKQFFPNSLYSNVNGFFATRTNFPNYETTINDNNLTILHLILFQSYKNDTLVTVTEGAEIF